MTEQSKPQTAFINIDWADNKIGEELSGYYGPFDSAEAADAWGRSQIRDGEWEVIIPQAPADVEIRRQS